MTLTRAKRCFIMVGNIMCLGAQKTWNLVGKWYGERGLIYNGENVVKNFSNVERMDFVPASVAEDASEK